MNKFDIEAGKILDSNAEEISDLRAAYGLEYRLSKSSELIISEIKGLVAIAVGYNSWLSNNKVVINGIKIPKFSIDHKNNPCGSRLGTRTEKRNSNGKIVPINCSGGYLEGGASIV